MVHSSIAATRVNLHDRMTSTAAKLSTAAGAYITGDDNSAVEITAAGASLET
jgi:hypothetical protein